MATLHSTENVDSVKKILFPIDSNAFTFSSASVRKTLVTKSQFGNYRRFVGDSGIYVYYTEIPERVPPIKNDRPMFLLHEFLLAF